MENYTTELTFNNEQKSFICTNRGNSELLLLGYGVGEWEDKNIFCYSVAPNETWTLPEDSISFKKITFSHGEFNFNLET